MDSFFFENFRNNSSNWGFSAILNGLTDKNATYEYILHNHKLNLKEPQLNISKKKIRKIKKNKDIWDIIKESDIKDYVDQRKIHTFTIDPLGSTDFDDAISFHKNHIGIHIADVTFWLDHFNIKPTFSSTIYLPHRKINMIPTILADNLCSLIKIKID